MGFVLLNICMVTMYAVLPLVFVMLFCREIVASLEYAWVTVADLGYY